MSLALVTGAAGFIGSHLSTRLIAGGYDVRGVDAFTSHYERPLKELNIAALSSERRFQLDEIDLAQTDVPRLLDGVEIVFHLAARPGVRDSWGEFDDYVHANITATRALLDACAAAGVRVVYASSSSVYGDIAELPVAERAALRPVSPYGATKAMTELLAGAYAASLGLDAVGLRYFTVYGPRQRPDMGLARFIEAANAGEPIRIYGDGLQLRDMTFVGDAVAATLAAAARGRRGSVYNVASSLPRALLEIVHELEAVLGSELQLEHEERKAGDVRDTWGDIDRAQRELGYEPRTPLRAGLEAQVAEAARRRAALAVL
ncbi:MAG TPA: NAD-dependent epimerase/dehydratase family protein [Solirubrobacteraceae bacterium]|nr:NAD-dependent epimerase/dehydratase family protein [Solirubrobacteraceae bacterium]